LFDIIRQKGENSLTKISTKADMQKPTKHCWPVFLRSYWWL